MNKTFNVIFETKNLGLYGKIPGLEAAMQSELVRVYNMYADETNGGVTDKLNEEFSKLYPTYFEDSKDKEWYDLKEYNRFMAEGYQRLVVDKFNETNASPILDFFVNPNEVHFMGCLKVDHNVTIEFYLKEA